MKSYASIDRFEGELAVCELELYDIESEEEIPIHKRKTTMIDLSKNAIEHYVGKVNEGDILLVENEDGKVVWIYRNDKKEKERRQEIIKGLMKRL